MNCLKVAPSDLVFLFEECQRCFFLKVHGLLTRPRMPMPKVFSEIDRMMKRRLNGQRTDGLALCMPRGIFHYSERWVESSSMSIPGCEQTISFRGRFDNVLALDKSGVAVVDLKTCRRRDEHIALYSRQLHAYMWSLENPAPQAFALAPVDRLGLLVFEPNQFCTDQLYGAALSGGLHWIEIERNDREFLRFIGEVLTVLNSASAPAANPDCEWCRYRLLRKYEITS
jgi:PD-(D/E)XK nuclease superfamily protein